MSKTTVIIPNFNGMEYLNNCLLSLEKCEPMDFEILVVDNGSTDGSIQLLKEKFPKVRYILLKENTGFAFAVNAGLKETNTPFALLLNNDTTVAPDFVKQLENAMEEEKNAFSISAKMVCMQNPRILDGAGDLYCALGWAFAIGKGKAADHINNRRKIFSSCGGAAIYRMEMLQKTGFFDENHFAYLEDVDIGYRARIYGYENFYEPSAVCLHAGSGFSGSRYNPFKISLSSRNSIYLVYKNMPFFQWLINLPFLIPGFLIKLLFFIIKGHGGGYCRGLMKGIALSFSKEGRQHKVSFKWKNLPHYAAIQLQLWINMIRRFAG